MTKLTLAKAAALQKVIHELQNFRFSSATTKKIAINLVKLNACFPDDAKMRKEILERHGNPIETDIEAFKPVATEFDLWVKSLSTLEVEVDLQKIAYEELNIGESPKQNQIPPASVAYLAPILDLGY